LSDFVPEAWVDPVAYASVILDFYSSALGRGSKARELSEDAHALVSALCAHPVTFGHVRFGQEVPVISLTAYSVYSDGERSIEARSGKEAIPVGDYVLIASPVRRNEKGDTVEGEARHALSIARGVLVSLCGHMAAEQLILSTRPAIEALDNMVRTAGLSENYEPPDIFAFCQPDTVAELGRRMALHIDVERRRRYSTALSFIGRAAAEMDATVRFSHLWIALEVIAGGSGVELMLDSVANSGGARSKLAEIKEARRQLFHYGRRYFLSQDQERLICAAVIWQMLSWYNLKDESLTAAVEQLGRDGQSGLYPGE
jgi:hypothetical protein